MSKRRDRLQYLQELLQSRSANTQQELVEPLKSAGYSVTQASLSRDLSFLGVVKKEGAYIFPEVQENSSILGITQAGENLLVVRTVHGMAAAMAYRIDEAKLEGVLGTIAGEDTIFVAVRSDAAIGRIRQTLATQVQ